MFSKQYLVHLLFVFWNPVHAIKFYEGKKSVQYDCNVQFDKSKEFGCACLSGVWKIYKSECEEIKTVGGLNYCFDLPPGDSVKRAEKILDSASDISIRFKNGTLLPVNEGTVMSLDSTELLTTGVDWSIIDSTGTSSCLSPTTENFCQFSLSAPVIQGKFTKGCLPSASKIESKNCDTLEKTNKNICEQSMQAGRVFLIAPGMNESVKLLEDLTGIDPADEDFYDKAKNVESRDEILTEIWNFIDMKLDNILALHERDASSNRSSVFYILDLATNVMKKTCPELYVKPEFFEMATYAFTQMQKKALKQGDFPLEFYAYSRIVSALENCTNNSQPYPFLNNFTCSSDGEPVGMYNTITNGTEEVNVHFDALPTAREPIIETVWKIFFNAHSTCYQYFDQSFNDHHRFTTWITPLFQNGIYDIWTKGKTENAVFGNMFGNMANIQTRIAYCAAYSRLDSPYPWDLPRPEKMVSYPATGGAVPVPAPIVAPGRRKRSVDQGDGGRCVAPIKLPKC